MIDLGDSLAKLARANEEHGRATMLAEVFKRLQDAGLMNEGVMIVLDNLLTELQEARA